MYFDQELALSVPASGRANGPRRRRWQARSQFLPAHAFTFPAERYCRGRVRNKLGDKRRVCCSDVLSPFRRDLKAAWEGKALTWGAGICRSGNADHSAALGWAGLKGFEALPQSWPRACQSPHKSTASLDVTKALKDTSSANLSSSHPAPPYRTRDADHTTPRPLSGCLSGFNWSLSSVWSSKQQPRARTASLKEKKKTPQTNKTKKKTSYQSPAAPHVHLLLARLFGCETWCRLNRAGDSSNETWSPLNRVGDSQYELAPGSTAALARASVAQSFLASSQGDGDNEPGRAAGGAAHHGTPEFSPLVAKGGRPKLNLYKLKLCLLLQ